MRSVDAAYQVLKDAGKPLHYREVARLATEQGLWKTSGKTPEMTINADMNQEILRHGKDSRFVRLGDGMFAAVPHDASSSHGQGSTLPPDAAYIVAVWDHMATDTRQKVLEVIRDSLAGKTVNDPVISAVLPQGPKLFPTDFLNADGIPSKTLSLPNEDLEIQRSPDGDCCIRSEFGFTFTIRNETEGMYILYAHRARMHAVPLPDAMIHVFKAVKAYELHLNHVWRELYLTYGRQCGNGDSARRYADQAFKRLGLPLMPVKRPSAARSAAPDQNKTARRGTGTPASAFFTPILQALEKFGGAARGSEVVKSVRQMMKQTLKQEDFAVLPKSGAILWEVSVRWARDAMVKAGLLKTGSPRGIWELSKAGQDHVHRNAIQEEQ